MTLIIYNHSFFVFPPNNFSDCITLWFFQQMSPQWAGVGEMWGCVGWANPH